MIGSIFTALTAWLFLGLAQWHWRFFAVVCAMPSTLCAILVLCFLPESPRRLYGKGRHWECQEALHYVAKEEKTDFFSRYQIDQTEGPRPDDATLDSADVSTMVLQGFKYDSVKKLVSPELRSTTYGLLCMTLSINFGDFHTDS